MIHKIKQSKPWAEQTYEERAADMMRFIDEMKALYRGRRFKSIPSVHR
jgi:hypothetical protein